MTKKEGTQKATAVPGRGNWVTRWWDRVKATAFPPGAITFHLGAFACRPLTPIEICEVARLLDVQGFERLLIVNGNALDIHGRVFIVAGSPGIGKSTACERLEACGAARLLEDGLVLLGVTGNRWVVVETGTLGVMRSASRIRQRLLRPLRALAARHGDRPWSGHGTLPAGGWVHSLTFRLAVLRHAGQRGEAAGSIRALSGLAVAASAEGSFPSQALDAAGSVRIVADLLSVAPTGLPCFEFSVAGGPRETVDRIVQTVLAVA